MPRHFGVALLSMLTDMLTEWALTLDRSVAVLTRQLDGLPWL
jgi:hypothetical protein